VTGRSLVQRSPTDCGVFDLETSRMRRPWPALGCSATEKKKTAEWLIICEHKSLFYEAVSLELLPLPTFRINFFFLSHPDVLCQVQ
jgi:hypothetical protein